MATPTTFLYTAWRESWPAGELCIEKKNPNRANHAKGQEQPEQVTQLLHFLQIADRLVSYDTSPCLRLDFIHTPTSL
jgi:hypothetical protein